MQPYYNSNLQMLNNLERQKENINNLIAQYSQPAPVQNIINTNPQNNMEFEAKILNENDDPSNIAVTRKTLFINEAKKKMYIKEVDGTISKEYGLVIPLDEKDKKILELESRIKEMEEKINVKYTELTKPNDGKQQSSATSFEPIKSTTKADTKSISKSNK